MAEIVLTSGYPRQAPQCKMITPVFHPNIDAAAICVGDHWAAAESLDDLVVRIAEIITYQSFNTKSPLNGDAARWADQNESTLPIDSVDLWPAEVEDTADRVPAGDEPAPPTDQPHCVNCGALESQVGLETDPDGRWICRNCVADCPKCSSMLVVGESLCTKCLRKAAKFVEHSRDALSQRDAAKARAFLEAGLREYPTAGVLRDELRAVTATIEQINQTTGLLKAAIKEHQFLKARELLGQLTDKPVHVQDLERARHMIVAYCEKTTALAKRGLLELNNDLALAEALFKRSLQVSADCAEAQTGLAKLDETKQNTPHLEARLLTALERGNPTKARAALTELLNVVALTPEQRTQLHDQVAALERARRIVRRILTASIIGAGLVGVVTVIII